MKVFDGLVSFLTDSDTSLDTKGVPPVYVTATTSVLPGICLPDTKGDAPPYDRTHNTQNLEHGQWWEQGLNCTLGGRMGILSMILTIKSLIKLVAYMVL